MRHIEGVNSILSASEALPETRLITRAAVLSVTSVKILTSGIVDTDLITNYGRCGADPYGLRDRQRKGCHQIGLIQYTPGVYLFTDPSQVPGLRSVD